MPSGHVMPLGKKWDLEIVLVKRGVCVKFGDPKIISMAVLYTAIAKILSEMSMGCESYANHSQRSLGCLEHLMIFVCQKLKRAVTEI